MYIHEYLKVDKFVWKSIEEKMNSADLHFRFLSNCK